jgi:hypothetical protein
VHNSHNLSSKQILQENTPALTSAITRKEGNNPFRWRQEGQIKFQNLVDPTAIEDCTKIFVTRFGGGSAEVRLGFSHQTNKIFKAKGWLQQVSSYCQLFKYDDPGEGYCNVSSK